jgi:hopanoid biosynthesis associated protein HpnK
MVAGPAAEEAVELARRLPDLRVGLHLVLTQGRPALPADAVPDLVDRSGMLRANLFIYGVDIALRRRVRQQLAAEIEAQFEAFRRTGLALDHVSAHEHYHLHPAIARLLLDIGPRYGMQALRVPDEPREVLHSLDGRPRAVEAALMKPWLGRLRRGAEKRGIVTADAVFGLAWTGDMTADRLAGLIRALPPGVVEIYLHPATADDFAGHAPGYHYRQELDALLAPEVGEAVRLSGREVGGYSDISATT